MKKKHKSVLLKPFEARLALNQPIVYGIMVLYENGEIGTLYFNTKREMRERLKKLCKVRGFSEKKK